MSSSRDKWNRRYEHGEHLGEPPLPFLVELARRLQPGRALDLAAGGGRHSLLLAGHGWQVTAVDFSKAALARMPETVTKVEADLEAGGYGIEPGAWDLIVVCYYLQRDLFPAIRAGVRPGGRVAAAVPLPGTINPAFTMPPGELRGLFADWHVEHYAENAAAELVARRPE